MCRCIYAARAKANAAREDRIERDRRAALQRSSRTRELIREEMARMSVGSKPTDPLESSDLDTIYDAMIEARRAGNRERWEELRHRYAELVEGEAL